MQHDQFKPTVQRVWNRSGQIKLRLSRLGDDSAIEIMGDPLTAAAFPDSAERHKQS
jgi:hypothetical protein